MPYMVWGRNPKRSRNKHDYAFDVIGSKRTEKAAVDLAQRYAQAGFTAVHIRKDKMIGHITKTGELYKSKSKPKKTTRRKK